MLTVQDVLASEKLTKIVMMSISNELADKGVSELYVSLGAGVVKN